MRDFPVSASQISGILPVDLNASVRATAFVEVLQTKKKSTSPSRRAEARIGRSASCSPETSNAGFTPSAARASSAVPDVKKRFAGLPHSSAAIALTSASASAPPLSPGTRANRRVA